jgi:eukaryotic-like serine/threonine-protein kinase
LFDTDQPDPNLPYKKGSLIGQKYEVREALGKGGFGIVYLVYSRETREIYALKTFRDEFLNNPETRGLFKREAEVWASLVRHPFIVRAHLVDEVAGRVFIALEYIPPNAQGLNTLEAYLQKQPPNLSQSLRWAIQLCYGMEYAYSKGMSCHRDIKPSNIMITREKTAKISDFGLASVIGSSNSAAGVRLSFGEGKVGLSGSILQRKGFGTPTHMSPEQFGGNDCCDERSDLYSFGVVLYQMAAGGCLPFCAAPLRNYSPEEQMRFGAEMYQLHCNAHVPELKSFLSPLVQRCLAKEPNNRYQHFRELRTDLETLLKQLAEEKVKIPEQRELEAWELGNEGASFNILGRFEDAIKSCDKALKINPQLADTWNNKGTALNSLSRFHEAIVCLDKALKIDSLHAEAWNNKGFSFTGLGNFRESIKCCDKALAINPRFVSAWNNKGSCLLSLSCFAEALTCYDNALKIDAQFADSWFNKGVCIKQLKRFGDAIAAYDKALEINPQYLEAQYNKGSILLEHFQRYADAIKCFDSVLKVNAKETKAWVSKGICLNRLGYYFEALKCYNAALDLDPNSAMVWFNKGYIFAHLSCFDEAIKCYSNSLKLDPNHVETWLNKAIAENMLGLKSEEESSLRTFIKLAPPQYFMQIEFAHNRLHELGGN